MDLAQGLRLVFTGARRIKSEALDQIEEPQPSSNGTGDGLLWNVLGELCFWIATTVYILADPATPAEPMKYSMRYVGNPD
jgi:hypothetical protein